MITGYVLTIVAVICLIVAIVLKSAAKRKANGGTLQHGQTPFKVHLNYSIIAGAIVLLGFGVAAILIGTNDCALAKHLKHRLDHVYIIYGGLAVFLAVLVTIGRLQRLKKKERK